MGVVKVKSLGSRPARFSFLLAIITMSSVFLVGSLIWGLLGPTLGVRPSNWGNAVIGMGLSLGSIEPVHAFPPPALGISGSSVSSNDNPSDDPKSLLGKPSEVNPAVRNSSCPDYSSYSQQRNKPLSSGKYQLAYQRPAIGCRTFNSTDVEATIEKMRGVISDSDLFRLFENTYPNTLDTAIRALKVVPDTGEELAFITTGDINAMWLRDSANQLQAYVSLLKPSKDPNSLAALYRGLINIHARYLTLQPFCNAFQPPKEVEIPITINAGAATDFVDPPPDEKIIWECKYELDSLAAFLQASAEYYEATKDAEFFGKYKWVKAVETIMRTVELMRTPTYGPDGKPLPSAYVFQRQTNVATETLANNGIGNPVGNGTGMIRSAFRPSDDATIYQLFVPANMMFARDLKRTAEIMEKLPNGKDMAKKMRTMATEIREGIQKNAVIDHPVFKKIYAYEIDGFGSFNLMDDSNIPSILSAPLLGFVDKNDPIYLNTRKFILSRSNPYFMTGPVISAPGGPHIGPGMAWPMASIVRIMTTDDDDEIFRALKEIVASTDGLGLIHESINSFNSARWTRQWFSWANGLFGAMILDLAERKPALLKKSYQPLS